MFISHRLANIDFFPLDEKDNLKKLLLVSHILPYIRPVDNGNAILGLDEYNDVTATAEEKAELQKYVNNRIPEFCNPIVDSVQKKLAVFPELFDRTNRQTIQIEELETQRFRAMVDLVEYKYKKCILLKRCAELRVSPQLASTMNTLLYEMKEDLLKLKLFQETIYKDIALKSPNSLHAIKRVEDYINTLLLKKDMNRHNM